MRNAIHKIQNPELPLRSRMFQLLSTIAMAEFIIVSVYTVVTGGDTDHIVMMLIGTVLFACTVTYTFRSDRMRLGSTISGLLYFLLYPLTFFSSGGMYGGAPVVFAFALVYVFLVTEKWERILALAVCITASGICFAVSYLSPGSAYGTHGACGVFFINSPCNRPAVLSVCVCDRCLPD